MGKLPYMFTDSEETEDASSSVENLKNKKRFSIMKYTTGNVKKNKCVVHSRSLSEPDEEELSRRGSAKFQKLRGILKHDRDRELSDEEEDIESGVSVSQNRCLVGRVPRPAGARPGRGGGVAILIRKNTELKGLQNLQGQNSTSSTNRRRSMKRLAKKKSY